MTVDVEGRGEMVGSQTEIGVSASSASCKSDASFSAQPLAQFFKGMVGIRLDSTRLNRWNRRHYQCWKGKMTEGDRDEKETYHS